MSLTSPAPGAAESRTDQGKDWSGVKKIVAVAAGQITNIYQGLSGFGTTIIEKIQTSDKFGPYVYYAEETGGGPPEVSVGQSVQQGQELAPGTGGVIEAGWWDTATGRSKGAPGFSESNPSTEAGRDFFAAIKGGIVRPGGTPSAGGSGGSSSGVDAILAVREAEAQMTRTMPSNGFKSAKQQGWKAPFTWWLQSFRSLWEQEYAGGGSSSGGSSSPSAGGGTGQAWVVTAGAEDDPPGTSTSCGTVPGDSRGYSVMSLSGTSHDPGSAGQALSPGSVWPCGAHLIVTYKGKTVTVGHVDIGSGSDGYLPTIGLYPGTRRDLGIDTNPVQVTIQAGPGSPPLTHPLRAKPA